MKKALTLLTIICSPLCSNSQSFVQPNSVWYYSADLTNNSKGYQSYSYEKDILIGKFTYKKISGNMITHKYNKKEDSYNFYNYTKEPIFIRQSNDTIYCLGKDGKDRFAWNQNPKSGDVWYFGEVCDPTTQITKKIYTRVDSVVVKFYNNEYTKTIYSTPNVDAQGNDLNENTFYSPLYIKKINTLFGPFEHFGNISQLEVTEYIDGNFTDRIMCYGSEHTKLVTIDKNNCFNDINKY